MGETSLLHNDDRLRAGWRIVLFFALFFGFAFVSTLVLSPLTRGPLAWGFWIGFAGSALLAGWIVLARLDGRPLGALGFALHGGVAREIGQGLLLGGALLALAVALLLVSGTAGWVPDAGGAADYAWMLVWSFGFFALAAAAEELLFRGYAFQALVEGIGVWPAVVASSLLFAWAHWNNPSFDVIAFANIFLAGVLLALAYLRTRSLWFATAVHLGWNWVMASLLDFPVSGLTELDTPLYNTVRESGVEWWTGGAFGPEGGLAGTLALLTGIVWTARSRRLGEADRMRELGPIVDRRIGPGRWPWAAGAGDHA